MSKKLDNGDQPPRQGCKNTQIGEVKLCTNTDSPMINVKVGDSSKPFTWLVDSGARESVVDSETFTHKFPGVTLQPMDGGLCFRSADGSPLNMLGSFITEFWFGDIPMSARVFVCKGLTTTRLIGANILSKFSGWGVDNKSKYFYVGDIHIPLAAEAVEPPNISNVTLAKDIKVPPRCGCLVPITLQSRFKPSELVFKPDKRVFYKRQLLMPICLVSTDIYDGTSVVRVTNPTDVEVVVHKGTKLGQVVNNVSDFDIIQEKDCSMMGDINSVSITTEREMESLLKRGHSELYKVYQEAGEELSQPERKQLLQILFKYRGAFSVSDTDIGSTNIIKHKIVPKSDKVVYRRQYRHSEEQHKQIDEEVEKLLKCGVIKESMSPFNNPVLMVPKKEKGKWRFCLDCRYINDLTEDQYFPIPRIDDAISSLAGATIFSVVDQTSGYHQVELDEETSEMCAFSTRKGHYQYTKLPMGLRGSGMTFQKMVTLLLTGMLHTEVLAYLDDCILYSNSVQQHMKTLEEVLRRFQSANLKLKPKKCKLFKRSIVYLGYLVDSSGVRPNPEATELIRNLPEPTSVTGVQIFLGKANYYRKFIPNLADIAHPLYELVKSKGKTAFKWEVEHQAAFDQIKAILTSGQVMCHPRTDREFVLDVDASDYALGVELSQVDDSGDLRPIFYGSRHLEKSERAYSATARETLAAVFGCEYFREYLQGRKFILRSDHNPLVWLRGMKEPKRPYSGWIMRLEQFEYKIQYRAGKEHQNADFNSRIPVMEGGVNRSSVSTQTETDIGVRYLREDPLLRGECFSEENRGERANPSIDKVQYVSEESRGERANPSIDKVVKGNVLKNHGERVNPSTDKEVKVMGLNEVKDNFSKDGITGLKACSVVYSSQSQIHGVRENPSIGQNGLGEVDARVSNPQPEVNGYRGVGDNPSNQSNHIGVQPSRQLLSSQQEVDVDIGPVMKRLQQHDGGSAQLTKRGEQLWKVRKRLVMKDGLLIRLHKMHAGLDPIEQVVLPGCLKTMVLESLHDSPFAGHFGLKSTTSRVQLRYYWPGYLSDVEQWCKSCVICQERKGPQSKNTAPLTSIDTGRNPFEQIALDILKLPLTQRGNQYVLVIQDYFTKWLEAFPLTGTAAPSVAQCVLNGWIARFGCPYTILSDQGREFESKLFKALNDLLQIKKLRTTTYHPCTDGMVERSNRTIIDVLSKYCEAEPDWDLKLPLVLFAIRTSEHATTGFSPFNLVYGQEARVPWDVVYGDAPNTPMPRERWVAERREHMSKVFKMVQDLTSRRQLQQKQYFDKNKSGKFQTFLVGEQVMYCDPAARKKQGKLNKPWFGPYQVLEKLSDALYKLQMHGKEVIVNTQRLKKYYGRPTSDPEQVEMDLEVGDQGDSSDEEEQVLQSDDDGEDEEEEPPAEEVPPQPQAVAIADEEPLNANRVREGTYRQDWGNRGDLRCNLNEQNIIPGGRRRRN